MKRQFLQFIARCVLNVLGIFGAALLIDGIDYKESFAVLAVASLLLSLINALVKPLVVILALPALLVTLGVFSVVINGLMVYLVHVIYNPFEVSGFGTAILAGLVIGLVNYIVTRVFDTLAPEET